MSFAFIFTAFSWVKGNWLVLVLGAILIAVLLGGTYTLGRMDERLAITTNSTNVTVTNYENERTINNKIRNSGFDAVLDLNDRMFLKHSKDK